MNVGQRWLCSQPGVIFLHVSFVVLLMTPTWQRGSQLDQLTTVFTGMGVQQQSNYFFKFALSFTAEDTSLSTFQLPAIHAISMLFLLLKLTVNFHFAFSTNV